MILAVFVHVVLRVDAACRSLVVSKGCHVLVVLIEHAVTTLITVLAVVITILRLWHHLWRHRLT